MVFLHLLNGPYLQLRLKIKMAAIFGGLCTESLWRGYRFAMNDIKKSNIFQVRHQMHMLCLTFDFLADFYYCW